MSYKLELRHKTVQLHLRRTRDLISSSYTETHYTPEGTRVTTGLQHQGDSECYYHGSVGGDQSSVVSISTCEGLRGFFRSEGEDYMIEPLQDSDSGEHAVFKVELFRNRDFSCGVSNHTMDPVLPIFNSRGRSAHMFADEDSEASAVLDEQKYIEMYLVVDHSEFRNLGSDVAKVRKRMFEIINFVNMVYLPLHTFIALVGLEVWSDGDKIKVSPPASSVLSAFTQWRINHLNTIKDNDNAELITAVNFGSIVGLANVGSLCTPDSTTIVRDFSSNALETGAILAHELGHNLGMEHDSTSCFCVNPPCIMAPVIRTPPAEHFSNCSVEQYEHFLQSSPDLSCLLDKPPPGSIISPPVCGNGFQEEGEECDCGSVEECTNPCCNAATCTLTAGSQCATGACCNNCKILARAILCREVTSECDLPEYCSGTSPQCPVDTYRENGVPCRNSSGYCYGGECPLRLDQCIDMWGDTAEVAPESCYDLNTKGTHYAYCTHPHPQDYIGCKQKDVMCGQLFCSNGMKDPRFGIGVTVGSCKATIYNESSPDYGLVQPGTKCGDGQVCSNSVCVELEVAYGEPNCSKGCRTHSVCNNVGQCQCVSGWVPPDCTQPYTQHITYTGADLGMSREDYTIMAVFIAVGVCALILVVILAVVWRIKKRKREQSHSRTEAEGRTKHDKTNAANPLEVYVIS
ncbi:zinc metalloproteinase-disintegrin-like jararhagin [Hoplias malabaricus]|uniref:zinc metalloproteinase-disintegrin-like jararhagin n=1 Tax=Hoplias malabaricus TaxID=27720 RepID=UPI003463012F